MKRAPTPDLRMVECGSDRRVPIALDRRPRIANVPNRIPEVIEHLEVGVQGRAVQHILANVHPIC